MSGGGVRRHRARRKEILTSQSLKGEEDEDEEEEEEAGHNYFGTLQKNQNVLNAPIDTFEFHFFWYPQPEERDHPHPSSSIRPCISPCVVPHSNLPLAPRITQRRRPQTARLEDLATTSMPVHMSWDFLSSPVFLP